MQTYKQLKRRYLSCELRKDASIDLLYTKESFNWQMISKAWQSLNKISAIPESEKRRLKNYMLHSSECTLATIQDACIYVFTWPSGESRCFITSPEGSLIETFTQEGWYSNYPFLNTEGQAIVINDSLFSDVVHLDQATWLNPSTNFTHFLYDYTAPFLKLIKEYPQTQDLIDTHPLVTCGSMPSWQREYLHHYGIKTPIHAVSPKSKSNTNSQFHKIKINKLVLPILTNILQAREVLINRGSPSLTPSIKAREACNWSEREYPLIMITRQDSRRKRIANVEKIEELVKQYGGAVVDAANLNFVEKQALFQACKVCIAESSGCMNWALFAPEESKLISLMDSSVYARKEFTYGGLVYFLNLNHRIIPIEGRYLHALQGSPLGVNLYDTQSIEIAIKQAMKNVTS